MDATEITGKSIKQPSEVVIGKVAFLFNNLTQSCLSEKVNFLQFLSASKQK